MIDDELAEHWDAAHLAVYADHLTEAGDPRGELVALDLADSSDAIRARKNELLVAWIGEQLLGKILSRGSIEHGFVELSTDSPRLLDEVLASPAGPYLRSLALRAPVSPLVAMLEVLSRDVRPWLLRLTIAQEGDLAGRAVTRDWATQLPRLRTLEVAGFRVFARLHAPSVRTLIVSGVEAIGSLSENDVTWPNLTKLDYAFGPHDSGHGRAVIAVGAMPAVVELDVSRNEPGAFGPHNYGFDRNPFAWLGRWPTPGQLERLRVPSVRTDDQGQLLVNAMARMPFLQRVEQVRRYASHDARFPVPPSVERVIGWPRPWPPPDEVNAHAYVIEELRVDLFPAAWWVDANAARFAPHVVDAWGHVFRLLLALQPMQTEHVPTPLLDTALGGLGEAPGLQPWTRLRSHLRRARPMRVAVRRV